VYYPFNRRRSTWPPLALVALLVGTFAISCGGSGEQRAEAPAEDEPEAAVEYPSLGDEGAPVNMTEYADFQ